MNQVRIYLPPPTNWQDFQIVIGELARVKYVGDSVQEFGRQGQTQNGVDVFAIDHLGKKIGIQCKETKADGMYVSTVNKEIALTQNFRPKLDLFVIATTLRTDANIQEYVNELNASRRLEFKVQAWFWDDVNREINKSQSVMSSYYSVYKDLFGRDDLLAHLATLSLAFSRPAFRDDFLHERSYQDFEQALVDTKTLLKIGFLYDRMTRTLISQIIPSSMIGEEGYRRFVLDVEKSLEKIYQDFLRDKRMSQGQNPRQLEERAGHYNISRRRLMEAINHRLESEHLLPIGIHY